MKPSELKYYAQRLLLVIGDIFNMFCDIFTVIQISSRDKQG